MSNSNSGATLVTGKMEIPRQFLQLGLVIVDGSGSMTEQAPGMSKAQATNRAIREMFTRFKKSRMAQNFAFAIISFDDKPALMMQTTDVGPALNDNGDYDPLKGHGGGTNIYAALEEAERIATNFLAGGSVGTVDHSVVMLVMSDGCCSDPARTRQVADRIKKGANAGKITICSTLFETLGNTDPAGEDLLRSIASNPSGGFKKVHDKDALRGFFIESISVASGVAIDENPQY